MPSAPEGGTRSLIIRESELTLLDTVQFVFIGANLNDSVDGPKLLPLISAATASVNAAANEDKQPFGLPCAVKTFGFFVHILQKYVGKVSTKPTDVSNAKSGSNITNYVEGGDSLLVLNVLLFPFGYHPNPNSDSLDALGSNNEDSGRNDVIEDITRVSIALKCIHAMLLGEAGNFKATQDIIGRYVS